MRKLTNLVGDELSVISDISSIETKYIHETKLSKPLKYHWFEAVTFEILDLEGYKYEEVDYFSWWWALGHQLYYCNWNKVYA